MSSTPSTNSNMSASSSPSASSRPSSLPSVVSSLFLPALIWCGGMTVGGLVVYGLTTRRRNQRVDQLKARDASQQQSLEAASNSSSTLPLSSSLLPSSSSSFTQSTLQPFNYFHHAGHPHSPNNNSRAAAAVDEEDAPGEQIPSADTPPPTTPPASHSLSSSMSTLPVPFLSRSLRFTQLEGRGVGFVAVAPIQAGELLLIDSSISVPSNPSLPYDWHAHASLVSQLFAVDPEALERLFVSKESIERVQKEYPIPRELQGSQIQSVDDTTWQRYLHAMANNAYIREELDHELDEGVEQSPQSEQQHDSVLDESIVMDDLLTPKVSRVLHSEPHHSASASSSSVAAEPLSFPLLPHSPPAAESHPMSQEASSSSRSSLNFLLLTCKLNHSCFPNACSSSGRVYACADISVGEEVCVSYLLPEQALYLPTEQRRTLLAQTRDFFCRCARCLGSNATMRDLESALTSCELSQEDAEALNSRIEELEHKLLNDETHQREAAESEVVMVDPSPDHNEMQQLIGVLDASYDVLPASHYMRFSLRRSLLLNPPSYLSSSQYLRFLLEHWCILQMMLPQSHLYKAFEAEEILQASTSRLLLGDSIRLLLRLDEAFGPNSAFRLHCEQTGVQMILQQRFGPSASSPSKYCTVNDCPNNRANQSAHSSRAHSSVSTPRHDAHSPTFTLSSFTCNTCEFPLVACSPECHFTLVHYHAKICSLLALTCTTRAL